MWNELPYLLFAYIVLKWTTSIKFFQNGKKVLTGVFHANNNAYKKKQYQGQGD